MTTKATTAQLEALGVLATRAPAYRHDTIPTKAARVPMNSVNALERLGLVEFRPMIGGRGVRLTEAGHEALREYEDAAETEEL